MIVNNQKSLFVSKWMQLAAISFNENGIVSSHWKKVDMAYSSILIRVRLPPNLRLFINFFASGCNRVYFFFENFILKLNETHFFELLTVRKSEFGAE